MIDPKIYDNDFDNKWCPGCGNFGILKALKKALAGLELPPQEVIIVGGIGQSGKTPHFLNCNSIHGLHGRALPLATGALLADPGLKILVSTGDGDCFAEGGNHFLHAARRNVDLTVIHHNNKVFGLTKGQASPTSDLGMTTKAQPKGTMAQGLNPLGLALTLGVGFVARSFSGRPDQLAGLIKAGVRHKGLAFIDVLQPCPSFNRLHTAKWYGERVYEIPRPVSFNEAWSLSQEGGERIPLGLLFWDDSRPSYTDRLPALAQGPLLERSFEGKTLSRIIEGL